MGVFPPPFPSFLWSDFRLCGRREAGGGGGAGGVSLCFSGPGGGHRGPARTEPFFVLFVISHVVSALPPPFLCSLLFLTLFSTVYTPSSQSLATESSGVKGQDHSECRHARFFVCLFFPS